jgi:hypothetical protein
MVKTYVYCDNLQEDEKTGKELKFLEDSAKFLIIAPVTAIGGKVVVMLVAFSHPLNLNEESK